MSNVFQIYLAGGMQDLSFEEQNAWRERIFKQSCMIQKKK